jgi:hypothetical protein
MNTSPREMFLRIMKNLYNLSGSKQYMDIASTPDPTEAQKKLDELLWHMTVVSNSYNYIPLADQEKIIEQKIIEDPEFYGLNARKIWHYLNSVSSKYFVQDAHKKTEEESRASNARAVTYDELTPETKAAFDMFVQSLAQQKKVPALTQDQIKEEGQEKKTPKATAGHIPTETEIQVARRLEVIKRMGYDKLSPKEVSEMQIFKIQGRDVRARNQDEAQEIYLEVYL